MQKLEDIVQRFLAADLAQDYVTADETYHKVLLAKPFGMKPSKVKYESPSTATVCFTCAIRGIRANIKRQMITDNLFMTFLYSSIFLCPGGTE